MTRGEWLPLGLMVFFLRGELGIFVFSCCCEFKLFKLPSSFSFKWLGIMISILSAAASEDFIFPAVSDSWFILTLFSCRKWSFISAIGLVALSVLFRTSIIWISTSWRSCFRTAKSRDRCCSGATIMNKNHLFSAAFYQKTEKLLKQFKITYFLQHFIKKQKQKEKKKNQHRPPCHNTKDMSLLLFSCCCFFHLLQTPHLLLLFVSSFSARLANRKSRDRRFGC